MAAPTQCFCCPFPCWNGRDTPAHVRIHKATWHGGTDSQLCGHLKLPYGGVPRHSATLEFYGFVHVLAPVRVTGRGLPCT